MRNPFKQFSLHSLFMWLLLAAILAAVARWHLTAAPDLVISDVHFYPKNPGDKGFVGTLVTVTNVGRHEAKDFDVYQSESTGTTHNGVGYGFGAGFVLQPGESVDYHWGAIRLGNDTRQKFRFKVDSEDLIGESNEKNNVYEVRYDAAQAVNLVDLGITEPIGRPVPYRQ